MDVGKRKSTNPKPRYITCNCSPRKDTKPSISKTVHQAIFLSIQPLYPVIYLSCNFYLPTTLKMTTAIVPNPHATKAHYVQLGTSGLRISNPVLGAMSFGDTNWMAWCLDESKALPILKNAYDQGINTWDTANNYSNGGSERIIAKAIKTYNIPRENLIIMTKCYFPVGGLCPIRIFLCRLC